ncbi:hypothetical protein H8K32_13895 [Undibacterium jejuense]|uniref:Uncharacterized protein n=1 Tax=Undibacterium jejuense TaxID=1344949 RepID=A0A923HER3_9BURK|nr:hypothetical protein [Undibacterium jejuense]MBC3863197.1 hypothetical protein [Undibacterium jejuense]
MENNIDKFNYYVGCVFAILQSGFPCRISLNFVEIVGGEKCPETTSSSGRWTGRYLVNGEVQDITKELEFVCETVNWLYETDYLIGSVGVTELGKSALVTLSPKSLEILKVVPSSIDASEKEKSIGQELSEAFNSAAKKQITDVASKALSYLFKIGWGALSGP